MPVLEQPTAGPLASIVKATQRLNPCMELDVDVLAVSRAAVASTSADWTAGTLTNVSPDTRTGALRLTPSSTSLFSQTLSANVHHYLQDSSNGVEEYALDFFPDPAVTQGVSFTLSSLDLDLRMGNLKGYLRVQVYYYDEFWRLVPMGDPIDILSGDIVNAVGTSGGIYTIDFLARSHRYVFPSGFQNTVTGTGYDGTTSRTVLPDAKGYSHLNGIARGLSISIIPQGTNATDVWIGCVANATAAQFDTTTFWRSATNRNCGPFDPRNPPYSGPTTDKNPDNYLLTGAVPGYGAIAVTNGKWGIARRIWTAQRAQSPSFTWEQPYHNLKVVAYPSSGTAVNVLDMGATPVNPVELRLDDVQPQGTSLSYVLKGSNSGSTGPWTPIAANTDGSVLTGGDLYRWYQLTTTFSPGPSGATKYATPSLNAWQMVERVTLSTYRYLKDFDSTAIADPVTAQSSISELKLPIMNAGRQDFRDLAAQLGSNYAPSGLEAHVYARNTRSGARYFLNSYRLENRNPSFGAEEMIFVSGMDRLTVKIPSPVETYRYPGSGQVAITNVTNAGAVYSITVAGTPFTVGALAGYRMHGVTGACAGLDFTILSSPANTASIFAVNIGSGAIPAIGDTFEIHSDVTTRTGAAYVSQDFAAVYSDLLSVQAAVPARYRGNLPPTTGRPTTYTLPAEGVKALDVLEDVALHCGGFPAWDKGRIQYADFYGAKDSAAVWDDRHIVSIETPVGADRRMPRVRVHYGYQTDTSKFTNQATYDDFDTITGWGLSNLFDVFDVPDRVAKWNDVNEAKDLANKLQKAWKSGIRLWKVKTILNYPWLVQGDAVTILTDQYTDRRLSYSADGLTDLGSAIAGKTSSIAVIVGKNLWGNEWIVAIRGLDQITSTPVASTGTIVGTPTSPIATFPQSPALAVSFDVNGQAILNSVGNAVTTKQIWVVRTDRVPTAAETRAGTTASSQSITNVATGTFVLPGHLVYVGALAYNANGDESALTTVAEQRQGGAWDSPRGPWYHLPLEERHRIHEGGYGVPGEGYLAQPYYDDSGGNPLIDPIGMQMQPLLKPHRLAPYNDGNYAVSSTTNDGFSSASGVKESGGKAINRLLGKALAGDPDSLDGTPEGTTYNRPLATAITSGQIDLSKAGVIQKYTGNITRSSGNATALSTIVGQLADTGHASTTMQESGGKLINRLYAKVIAGDVDSLDGVIDGAVTYKRVLNVSAGLIQTASIAALAVTDAKVNDVSAGKTTAGTFVTGVLGKDGSDVAGNRTAQRAVGTAAWGIGMEEAARASRNGGYPVPGEEYQAQPQYDASGGSLLIDPVAMQVQAALKSHRLAPFNDGNYALSSTTNDGLSSASGVKESGGKAINRLLGKALAGDPDSLDGTPEGTTYKRVTTNAVDGSSNIDFSKSGFANKHLGNIPDDATSNRRAVTANQQTGAGNAFTGLDTNGRFVDSTRHTMLVMGGAGSYQGIMPLSSSGLVISIAAHTLHVGSITVTYNAGSVTVASVATWYIYVDDPTYAGGTVTYFATSVKLSLADANGRYYVGQITVASSGGGTGAVAGGSAIKPQ